MMTLKLEKELESTIIWDISHQSNIIAFIVKFAYIIPQNENLCKLTIRMVASYSVCADIRHKPFKDWISSK
jgi:hypothetical protein